jgi:hypothetical protein
LSKPRNRRVNNATLPPLTPSGAFNQTTQHTVPDLKVEAALYKALQSERHRSERLVQKILYLEGLLKKWKTRGYVKCVARKLTRTR